jgi:hypothetical protein
MKAAGNLAVDFDLETEESRLTRHDTFITTIFRAMRSSFQSQRHTPAIDWTNNDPSVR